MKFYKHVFLLLLCPTLLQAAEKDSPGYVTSPGCQACHEQQYRAWSDSHHSWAWREPSPDNVLGDFDTREQKIAAGVISKVNEAITCLLSEDLTAAMNRYRSADSCTRP